MTEKTYKVSEGLGIDYVSELFSEQNNEAISRIEKYGRPISQIEKYLDSIIKDDPLIVRQLLRAMLSAYTNEPINIGVLAPTSEGKTYATVEVSNVFPESDIISIGRMSPTALIHTHGILVDSEGLPIQEKIDQISKEIIELERNGGDKKDLYDLKQTIKEIYDTSKNLVDLTHKIILFLDNPVPATYEMLKPIMSHDKKEIIYRTTKSDGTLSVKETIIRGWPVIIACSAKNEAQNEVWPEIATRFFMVTPNGDIKKYKHANKLSSQKMGLPSWASDMYDNHEDRRFAKFYINRIRDSLIKLCKDGNAVYNPFHEILANEFPHNEGVTMRHYKRLLSFINIETLTNSYTNMKIEFVTIHKEKKYSVITSLQDITNAIKLLGKISTIPPNKILFYEDIFVTALIDKQEIQTTLATSEQQILSLYENDTTITSKELAKKYTEITKKIITPKQITENFLKPLEDEGLIESMENPENKKQNLYYTTNKPTIHDLTTVEKTIIDSVDSWLPYIWSGVVLLGRLSMKIGKIKRIFDSTTPYITKREFDARIINKLTINEIRNTEGSLANHSTLKEEKS